MPPDDANLPDAPTDRLRADVKLEAGLRRAGFTGPDWEAFTTVLAEYGLGVIASWMATGKIQSECLRKRLPAPTLPQWVQENRDAIMEVACETVAEAINHFRDDVLVPGRWDPSKGASLRTFFVGQCLLRYPNMLRRWLTENSRDHFEHVEDFGTLAEGSPSTVEDDVIRSLTAQQVLAGIKNPRAAQAMAMQSYGYTAEEIATHLNASVNSVNGLIKRARASLRKENTA